MSWRSITGVMGGVVGSFYSCLPEEQNSVKRHRHWAVHWAEQSQLPKESLELPQSRDRPRGLCVVYDRISWICMSWVAYLGGKLIPSLSQIMVDQITLSSFLPCSPQKASVSKPQCFSACRPLLSAHMWENALELWVLTERESTSHSSRDA